ncbi:MAG: sulfotransferase [Pseudomonadota bacterium]
MKVVQAQSLDRFVQRNRLRVWQTYRDAANWLSWRLGGRRRFSAERVAQLTRDHRWLFLVGCNNSGTSLVESLIEQTGVVSGLAREGQRYTRTLARAARRGHERVWTEFLDDLRMDESAPLDCVPQLVHDWTIALDKPLQPTILEKTTANIVRMRWLQKAFPNSAFIVMVRDGFAVTEGVYRKGEQDVARAARHWNLVYEIALRDAQHIDNLMFLKYEDVVNDRAAAVASLADFCGIDAALLDRGFDAQYSFLTADGRDKTGIRDMNQGSVSRLGPDDIEIITREAGAMLSHFGYPTPGAAAA